MSIPLLRLDQTTSRERGRAHGEHFRSKIAALYEVRRELTLSRTDLTGEPELLALASRHLPIAEAFDADLYEELIGISEGSGLGLSELVVVNHYTDLRDLSRAVLDDGGCSVLHTPPGILGQTWDMHGSATEYVCVLDVGSADERVALFSITGCLGMTGLNAHGLGMTINNLNSVDAKIGILWPTLVRRCLRERSARDALKVLEAAPLGSGHHYVVADPTDFFGMETSGTRKKITQEGADKVHLHTNHCLDEEMIPTARVPAVSSTHRRLEGLHDMEIPSSAQALFASFSAVSMARAQGDEDPHRVATCGAFVMDLAARTALACDGSPGPNVTPTVLDVST